MKKCSLKFPGRSLYARGALTLFLVVLLPQIAPAPIIYGTPNLTTGITTDYTLLSVEISYAAVGGWTNTVQFSPDLVQWNLIDAVTPSADGTVSLQYFFPLSTTKAFFRLGLPQPQINSVQPFTVSTSGGMFFIIGQVFDPSYQVRIDGNLVSSTFINSSTIQVNVGALAPGFHTITIVDSGNNVVATFSNGLFVTNTGRTDQESSPSAPLVNEAITFSGGPSSEPDESCGDAIGKYEWDFNYPSSLFPPIESPPGPPENPWLDPGIPLDGYWVLPPGVSISAPPPTGPTSVDDPKDRDLGWDRVRAAAELSRLFLGESVVPNAPVSVPIEIIPLDINGGSSDSPKLDPLFGVPRVNEATGEVFVEYLDLIIPGRGLDLVWGRTYRSKIGFDTPMGVGWDFSYNIRAQMNGPNVTVQDGQNRIDTYFLQPDGSFSTDELFRRVTISGQVVTVQFADKTNWVFKPLDGSPTSGKIDRIIDRNSNQLQFQYDPPTGRLMLIIDTLGRPFQIGYDGAGRIQFVQDFLGRQIQYTHHTGAGPGGSLGDLLSVRSQVVTGTPIGNDFPAGKTAQFTYSFGFGDAPRNHNLLTARDGNNVQWFQAVYNPTSVTTDLLYDRVASVVTGIANERTVFTFLTQTPAPANRFATIKAIVNDAVGNVHESLFDSKNRLVDLRQFTGRSNPGIPVTESTNRPINPLRPSDPAFFRTTIDWNRDSLLTRMLWPRGNGVEMVYERDFDQTTNPRFRANVRVERQLPVSGAPLVQRFEHQAGFGTCEVGRRRFDRALISEVALPALDGSARDAAHMTLKLQPEKLRATSVSNINVRAITLGVSYTDRSGTNTGSQSLPVTISKTKHQFDVFQFGLPIGNLRPSMIGSILLPVSFCSSSTDARGFTSTYSRDPNGNLTHAQSPDPATASDFEYNANGQCTAIVLPPNASTHRERDECHYLNGYLQSFVRDVGGLNLTTAFTRDPAGNVVQIVDPRGNDTQFFVNQLNQLVQVTSRDAGSGIRYLTNIYRDANDRITHVDVQNKDEFGAVGTPAFFVTMLGYDSLDHITSMTRTVDSGHNVTTQYFYNAIRDLIEARSPLAVSAVQPDARVQYAYDERNLPFTLTVAPSSPNATGSTYSYDQNGNLTTIETGAPAGSHHITTAVYDGFDRLGSLTSPVGTQVQLSYNANHQPTQWIVTGSFLDNVGNPTTGMLASAALAYASTGVCTQRVDSFFDIVFQLPISDGARTTTYGYDPALNRTSVTDDNGHATSYSYDGANRLNRVTDPKGNRVDYTYDNNGNLVTRTRTDKSDTAAPDQAFAGTYGYDGLDRLISATDNVGNARSYMYDSRSNRVRSVDPRTNLTQYQYDGLNRLIRSGRDMNANSSGFDVNDIVRTYSYDDNSRVISGSDPNSHATQYQYDPLGRLIQRTNADTTIRTWSYNPWGRVVQSADENGTTYVNNYDNLSRLKQRTITPGPGVSNATTFELYDYPGDYPIRERAINDAGAVRYMYDSLGRVVTETLNNRTTTYSHDGVGNVLTLHSPGGRTLAYGHDAANLCTSLSLIVTGDGDSLGSIATYSYIGRRVESATHRNATSTSYIYDGFVGAPPGSDLGWGQLAASVTTGPGPTILDQRTFTYDADGNLSERHDTRAGGPQLLHHYDYDAANRNVHTQVSAGGPPLRDTIYNYDLNGNRIVVNGPGTPNPGAYVQDATTPAPADAQMNQYTSTPLGNYLYDANGNRTNLNGGGGNTTYKYDFANRLIDLTDLNTGLRVANYQYDALNRRVQKTLDPDGTPSVINFVYSGRRVLEERDGGGAVTAAYSETVEGEVVDPPVEMRRGGNNFTIPPSLSRPWVFVLTNASGAAVERYDFEDFGDPHFFDGAGTPIPSSAIGNPYLFRGMRFDGESGLYCIRDRDTRNDTCRSVIQDRDTRNDTCICSMFDPRIGATLQRESSHAVNGWRSESINLYYVDPWEWTGADGWVPIPIDP